MPTFTRTFTRTHLVITPANPFLACAECGKRAERLHAPDCGCDRGEWPDFSEPLNFPCGHHADYNDLCPSWSPVDGCSCLAHLGYIPHPLVLATA